METVVAAGTVELSVQNAGESDRSVIVVLTEDQNLAAVSAYDPPPPRQGTQDAGDIGNSVAEIEAMGLAVDIVMVSHRDGFQPVVNTEAMDSGRLIGSLDVAPSSQANLEVSVDGGAYLLMDPGLVFCERPLLLRVSE